MIIDARNGGSLGGRSGARSDDKSDCPRVAGSAAAANARAKAEGSGTALAVDGTAGSGIKPRPRPSQPSTPPPPPPIPFPSPFCGLSRAAAASAAERMRKKSASMPAGNGTLPSRWCRELSAKVGGIGAPGVQVQRAAGLRAVNCNRSMPAPAQSSAAAISAASPANMESARGAQHEAR